METRRELIKDFLLLLVMGVISYKIYGLKLVYLVFFAWIVININRPLKLLYFSFLLFPVAGINYKKPVFFGTSFDLIDILLTTLGISILLSISIRKIQMLSMASRGFDRRARNAIALVAMYSIGIMFSSVLKGWPLTFWVMTLGYFLAFITAAMFVKEVPDMWHTILLFKLAGVMIIISTILVAYGIISPDDSKDLLNARLTYRSYFGTKYSSSGFIAARGGFGVNMAFILPFVMQGMRSKGIFDPEKASWGILSKPARIVSFILFVLIIFSVIITGSRSTWMMALVVVCIFLLYDYLNNPIFTFLILSMVGIIVFVFLKPFLMQSISWAYSISPSSVDSRLNVDLMGLKAFALNPLVGGSNLFFKDAYRAMGGSWLVHNLFIYAAANYGLLGVVPLFLIFVNTFGMLYDLRKCSNPIDRMYVKCFFCGLPGMLVELMLYSGGEKQLWVYLGLILSFYIMAKSRMDSDTTLLQPRAA